MTTCRETCLVRARRLWTGPGRPLVDDGALAVDLGRIAACGRFGDLRREFDGPVTDLGEVTICPALINCHCHLELSHLHGRVPGGQGFAAWVAAMLALPPSLSGPGPDAEAMARAAKSMADTGTAFVADVTGRAPGMAARTLAGAGLGFWLCVEYIGHESSGPEESWPCDMGHAPPDIVPMDRVAAGGHALFSTAPEALMAARGWSRHRGRPFSLHLAEHEDEEAVLGGGTGQLARMLARRLLPPDWTPPGMRPVAYADSLGLLAPGTLAVHGVRVTADEARLLAERGAAVCLCPRSNRHIGVGDAPWGHYRKAGTQLCVGTDSLASNADLDLWNEARLLLDAGAAPMDEILGWMTLGGARALGVEKDHGTLEVGRIARYTVVPDDLARLLEVTFLKGR